MDWVEEAYSAGPWRGAGAGAPGGSKNLRDRGGSPAPFSMTRILDSQGRSGAHRINGRAVSPAHPGAVRMSEEKTPELSGGAALRGLSCSGHPIARGARKEGVRAP